jgi:hypothetical protein
MNEEQVPNVEDIKARLKTEEIPVDEEAPQPEKHDVVAELKGLGRQFAETLEKAWSSEERQRFESQVREGVQSFVKEVDTVIRDAKQSPTAEKVRGEAIEIRERVETGELSRKARVSLVQGLSWLSEELAKLAEQFAPPEKTPEDVTAAEPAEEQDQP